MIGVRMPKSITLSKPRASVLGWLVSVSICDFPGSSNAASTGASVSAVIDDNVTANANTNPNSENTPPA